MLYAIGLAIALWLGLAAALPAPTGPDFALILLPISLAWLLATLL